ncbi:Spectrin repeat superfamily Extracellular matrix-binding protein, putative [Babesia ovata]|uniref:Spectrin repeat superfamily Extracellular matrix-binding protein, putative n=1 Tax=Babesia ovata TaxID=189622 RepID=A0A2H6KJC8_9APIC|nr:Spectrin repeat superfamily Extracellular matrix-binding protein, putative [Babesia ovata]GBE63094.1 Spectrin repeat superfamily Extracellular matrix-binding protein, putative [Babesia ovata]
MSFLHGVLESVKDDDNVTTYDNNMSTEPKLGTGPEDFEKALADVSWWTARYRGESDTRTQGLKIKLGELMRDKIDYEGMKSLSGNVTKRLQDQLQGWKETLTLISTEITNITNTNVSTLDSALQNKINVEIEPIKSAVSLLLESAQNKVFVTQVKNVDEVLVKQEEAVRWTMVDAFEKIRASVTSLENSKNDHIKCFKDCLKEAQGFLDNDFETIYKGNIWVHFDGIKHTINEVYENIAAKYGEITAAITTAQGHFKEIQTEVQGTGDKSKEGLSKDWFALTQDIQNIVNDVAKMKGQSSLKDIVERIKDYAKGFSDGNFESVLGKWIGDILEKEESAVNSKIYDYVRQNHNKGKLDAIKGANKLKAKEVERVIIAQLPGPINTDIKAAAVTHLSGVTVENIAEKLQQFAAEIGNKLMGRDSSIGTAVQKIGEQLEMTGVNPLTPLSEDTHLKPAVQAIAKSLADRFKQYAAELKSFIDKSKLSTNLTQAIEKVNEIGTKISTGEHANGAGKKINEALKTVGVQITKLEKILKDQTSTLPMAVEKLKDEVLNEIERIQKRNGVIDAHKNGAEKVMINLKNEISAKLNYMELCVSTANTALDDAITHLRTTLNDAHENTKKAVDDAFHIVTNHVRLLFTEQKKADLNAVGTLVERQLREITHIIETDRVTGAKGFLAKMKDDFIDPLIKFLNTSPPEKKKLADLAKKLREYFATFFTDLQKQTDFRFDYQNVETFKSALTKLLKQLGQSEHFDHNFSDNLNALQTTLHQTVPHKFGEASTTLLQSLKDGIVALADQLEKAYVNKYSGEDWKKNHADKYAKIMLTSTSTLYEELYHLFYSCHKDWSQLTIDGSEKVPKNKGDFGKYLESQGYQAASLINKNHTGQEVAEKLKTAFSNYDDFDTPSDLRYSDVGTYLNSIRREWGPMSLLYRHLATYYSVCQIRIPTAPKSPCTIRDMLGWMCGLPYTAVYHSIKRHCNTMLNEKINGTDKYPNKEDPVLRPILETGIVKYIAHTCQYSYETLTTICGNGRGSPTADYPYASNFCDNSRNFYYPQRASELLDMLKAMCTCLLRALYFMYSQCKYTVAEGNGWRDCQYGGNVSGYQWDCKKSVDKPMCQENTEPKCQAKCQPNDQTTCYPKSPLQAHLMDGLPGHLPHKLSSIGCTSKCSTCPKQSPGMVCLTPMGFWDLTHAGSKKGTGKDICNVLFDFCGNADSPLPTLLNYLMQVSPMPPKSLADQFSFFTNIFRQWSSGRFSTSDRLVNHMNTKTIPAISMRLYADEATNFTNQLKSLSGPTSNHKGKASDDTQHCDLYCLSTHTEVASQIKCNEVNSQCAPYLKPLCADAYHTYATKHANLYLSWLTYLPFDFYNLLKSLFEAFCNIDCKSGLENFLGYEKGNYTGEGIVYSDLDRLCDGVMSFLHGVLHNIQPKLGLHSSKINNAIESLKLHKHSGKDGFNAAIGEVVTGVRQYNEGVKASNESVSEPIKKLLDYVKIEKGKLIRDLHNIQVERIAEDKEATQLENMCSAVKQCLEECQLKAETFSQSLHSQTENIKDLNPNLQMKIENVRKNVKHERDRLAKLSEQEKEELEATKAKIKEVIGVLKCNVDSKIGEQVRELIQKLRVRVEAIKKQLEDVERKLFKQLETLQAWIQDVNKIVQQAINKVDLILEEIDSPNKQGNKKAVEDAAEKIQEEVPKLYKQFDDLNAKYDKAYKFLMGENGTGTTDGRMKELSTLYEKATEDVPKEINNFRNGNDWNVSRKMGKLMVQIQQNVKGYVGTLAGELKDALNNGIAAAWNGNGVYNAEYPGLKYLQGTRLGQLQSVSGALEVAIIDKTLGGLGENLEKALNGLHHAKTHWVKISTHIAKMIFDGLGEELGKNVTDAAFNKELLTLLQDTAEKGINKLQGKINEIVNSIQSNVNNNVSMFVDAANQAQTTLFNEASTVTSKLASLCYDLKNLTDEKTGLKQILSEMRDKYFAEYKKGMIDADKSINNIHNELSNVRTELVNKPMHAVGELLKYITTAERQTIRILKQDVETECKSAEEKLIHHAQKQYVNSLKALLTAFSDKLGKDLHGLPREIAGDLEIGHKGFMAKFEEHFIKYEKSIESIKSIKITHAPGEKSPLSQAAIKLATAFRRFLQHLQKQPDFTSDITKINPVHGVLTKLLTDLNTSNHFDHEFTKNLHELHSAVAAFKPSTYGEAKSPLLLNALRNGFSDLVEQLKNAYVSVYDDAKIDWTQDTNPEKGMCAKACLSIVPTLFTALTDLKSGLEKKNGKRKTYTIYNVKNPNHSLHSRFLRENGYDSDLPDDAEYGELNHKADIRGEHIYNNLTNVKHKLFTSSDAPSASVSRSVSSDEPTFEFTEENGVLSQLHNYLKKYFNVCHTTHIDKPRTPCNIYEMLLWCSGLQFNRVYKNLREHCESLFEKKPDERHPDIKIGVPIPAYPKYISRDNVDDAIYHITSRSYQLLTAVLGTGDAECKYASDFCTNFLRLQYPSRGEDCLHTLLDILRRLFPALQFLQSKCSQPAIDFGWGDCLYGKEIPSAKQPCNEHPTDQSTCESKCQPTCQPTCQPNCQPTCQPTSPLMSYLNDCLPGHLPHQLQSVGCKSICSTCPKSGPGVPCMTPLGFRAFSGSVKTGRDICDIIREFLGHEYIPALFSLVPKPPFTLPEHFSFTLSLVRGWHRTKSLIKQSVESSINDLSIALCEEPSNLTDALTDAYGADCNKCEHAHVTNLTSSGYCGIRGKDVACAPYLSSLSSAVYRFMAEKHGKLYLSWAIYLPWAFHNYLCELLEAFTAIFCEDWGCRSCLQSAYCRRGKHGLSEKKDGEDAKPHCQCTSIAKCNGVTPTFYHYGFIIPDAWTLHEEGTRKTCSNFYDDLKNVVESEYFTNLFEAPLVAVAPVPAAHRRRPPRRPEDTLPPAIALKPPHRRPVPPRRRTRQGTRQQDARKGALEDIEERQKTLKELKEKLEAFIGNKESPDNPATDILKNLTDGLEKILGFNSTSKGYDGTGIVYSDLDRLCDGVMSFLHGVLETVKDDESVKTYNKYITPDTNQLENVLQLLTSSIGTGRDGLSKSVKQVREWLGKYNEEVDSKTRGVTDGLSTLIGKLHDGSNVVAGDYYNQVKDQEGATLQVQLTRWTETVEKIQQEVQRIDTTHVKPLDNSLKSQITHEINVIHKSVNMLHDSAVVPGLREQVEKVEETLKEQKEALQERIAENSETVHSILKDQEQVLHDKITGDLPALQNVLKEDLDNIGKKINMLRDNKVQHFAHIRNATNIARQHVEMLERDYRMSLQNHLNDISSKLIELDPANEAVGGDGTENSQFKKEVEALKSIVRDIDNGLQKKSREMVSWKEAAGGILIKAQQKCNEILQRVDKKKGGSVVDIKDNAEKLQQKAARLLAAYDESFKTIKELAGSTLPAAVTELQKVYNEKLKEVNSGVSAAVTQALEKFSELDGKIIAGLKELQPKIAEPIKQYFTTVEEAVQAATAKKPPKGAQYFIENISGSSMKNATDLHKWLQGAKGDINVALNSFFFGMFEQGVKSLYSLRKDESGKTTGTKNVFDIIKDEMMKKVTETMTEYVNKGQLRQKLTQYRDFVENTGSASGNFYKEIEEIKKHVAYMRTSGTSGIEVDPSKIPDLITASQPIGSANPGAQPRYEGTLRQIQTEALSAFTKKDYGPIEISGNVESEMKSVAQQFGAIERQLNELTKCVSGGSFADGGEKGVRTLLGDLQQLLGTNGLHQAKKGFESLKKEFESLQATNVQDANRAIEEIQKKFVELQKIPGEVKALRKKTQELMDRLRDEVKNNFDYIAASVDTAENALSTAIQDLQNTLSVAYQEAISAVDTLNDDLNDSVQEAFATSHQAVDQLSANLIDAVNLAFYKVTNAVQKMFVEQHTADLTALHNLVKNQKNIIDGIIQHDLSTGVKGLLGVMQTQHETLLPIPDSSELKDAVGNLKNYWDPIVKYIHRQHRPGAGSGRAGRSQPKSPDDDPQISSVYSFYSTINSFLQSVAILNCYNHALISKIHDADSAIEKFHPSKFSSKSSNPLLDIIKSGFGGFVDHLKKAYVSTYSAATDKFNMAADGNSEKCGKVCLTLVGILYRDLLTLYEKCKDDGKTGWNKKQINVKVTQNIVNPLGEFFDRRGFKVATRLTTQDGELRNKPDVNGEKIKQLIERDHNIFKTLLTYDDKDGDESPLYKLYKYTHDYSKVCHLEHISSPKPPSNIYQMLMWSCGLQYNPVYYPLCDYIKTLFDKPNGKEDRRQYSEIHSSDLKLEAHPKAFSAWELESVLDYVCSRSHDVLTSILGHGHSHGLYACEFNFNPTKLSYPSNPAGCFDMLVDIFSRIFHQLCFTYEQCRHPTTLGGWSDCHYGKGVGGSAWNCNKTQCANQECNLRPNQKVNQNGNQGGNQLVTQTCDQHPSCGVKSPLQSFLEDGLRGFLPHTFTKPGCKLECTVSNHRGLPCKTPLGFGDLTVMASHTKTGAYLKSVLRDFCGRPNTPLALFCSYVRCLLPRPPQTLEDMFALYYNLLNGWDLYGKEHKETAFNDAIDKANFKRHYDGLKVYSLFSSSHSTKTAGHSNGDLISLVCTSKSTAMCAAYFPKSTPVITSRG